MRSSLHQQLSHWLALASVTVLATTVTVGCADADESTDSSDEAVTTIPQSAVQHQTVGNCWLYSTVAWVESMEMATTGGQTRKLSEDWLTYWSWYEVITQPTVVDLYYRFTDDHFETGGWYEISTHIMERYGVADASFKAGNIGKALERVRAAFKRGAPLGSLQAQLDGARVRAVLDEAFELPPATRTAIDGVFGKDGQRPIDTSRERTASRQALGLRAPAEVAIFLPNPQTHARERRTLADAVGHESLSFRDLIDARSAHSGAYAWQNVKAPVVFGSYRDWVRRVQRALNDGYAVPATWYVDRARSSDRTHFYGAVTTTSAPHASLITDYQAENVPGFGELKLGVPETRPQALQAALGDGVQVTFIRLKNSWGQVGVNGGTTFSIPGYVDLADTYYSSVPDYVERAIRGVYLPAGY